MVTFLQFHFSEFLFRNRNLAIAFNGMISISSVYISDCRKQLQLYIFILSKDGQGHRDERNRMKRSKSCIKRACMSAIFKHNAYGDFMSFTSVGWVSNWNILTEDILRMDNDCRDKM